VKIYTRKGDDGTTGLFYGGRVSKADLAPEAYGTVDEAVAALGLARGFAEGDLAAELLRLQRSLFVVGAELATDPANRSKLEPGVSLVTEDMVTGLESDIDRVTDEIGELTEFIVPGEHPLSGALDVARSVVRRAERRCVEYAEAGGLDESHVVPYLNRLADYVFTLVRASESTWQPSKE
jgi:cob(I)alamin adenosyltransferase